MRRIRGYAQVAAILALELAAIFVLHRMGSNSEFQVDWNNFSTWLSTTQLQTLIATSARLLGLVIAYYLFITTALYTLASICRIGFAVRMLRFVTVPAVRRSLDKALAATALTASIVGGSATFASAAEVNPPFFPPPIVQESSSTTTDPTGTTTSTTAPADNDQSENDLFPPQSSTTSTTKPKSTTSTTTQVTIPGLGATTVTTTPAPALAPTPSTPAAPTTPAAQGEQAYTVVPGDNLWSISKQHLANVRGVDASTLTDHEIAKYWLRVIEVNKPNLRSGNPNLIYPGEQITLPDVSSGS